MLKGKRVLVVEDEPLVAIEISAACEAAGAAATCAVSIDDALVRIDCGAVDLCILDTKLWGGRESDEIADRLRQKRIPFAVYSAHGMPRHGAIAHVNKPKPPQSVVAAFETYLAWRP